MRRGTPDQLIAELTDKITQLRDKEIGSSTVVIDDDEDLITADEEIFEEDIFEDKFDEEIEEVKDVVNVSSESEDYLSKLYEDVENELEEEIESVAWSGDDVNVYMDTNLHNGHVLTFTIPKEDLTFSMEGIDKDIEYICVAVRESQEPEKVVDEIVEEVEEIPEDREYEVEDFYEEIEDAPVYL